MFSFKLWEALSREELSHLTANGLSFVDQFEADGYLMYLLKVMGQYQNVYPADMHHQIGFQAAGRSAVFNQEKQPMEKDGLKKLRGVKSEMEVKLDEWLDEVGVISIASMVPEKTLKWGRILAKMGFNTQVKNHDFMGQQIQYVVINPY